jgi:hypothetical protein
VRDLEKSNSDLVSTRSQLDNALLLARRLSEVGVHVRCDPSRGHERIGVNVEIDSRMLHDFRSDRYHMISLISQNIVDQIERYYMESNRARYSL